MRTPSLPALLALLLLPACDLRSAGGPAAPIPEAAPPGPTLRLGVIDTRLLAAAWYRSAESAREVAEAQAAHDRARAAGEEDAARSIVRSMEERQQRAEEQTFAAAPIPGILARVSDQIPALAAAHGVDAVVARRDILHLAPGAEVADLSLALCESFHPDEATLRVLRELAAKPPVSAASLRPGHH
jgi:hypothetical protein